MAELDNTFKLKSLAFRREREGAWLALEALIEKTDKGRSIQGLTPQELQQLPILYRSVLSSLSVARAVSLDRNLIVYLESLAMRAYFLVYGTRIGLAGAIRRFFTHGFPQTIRQMRLHLLISALFLVLGVASSYLLVLQDEAWYSAFVSVDMAGDRMPGASTEVLRDTLFKSDGHLLDELTHFASYLFSHNSQIGMLAFALGFLFAIPTILLTFFNGLPLGSMVALYESHGLALDFLGWLSIHGTTELLAIIICCAAGLRIGTAAAFPGQLARTEALAQAGRQAAGAVIGAVAMLFIAGILEGFGRQLIQDTMLRFGIGILMLIGWVLYFGWAGRERDDG